MISATTAAETTPDHCDTAPACWLIAERVSEPEPGMHWKNAAAMLARPRPMQPWLLFRRCSVVIAMLREMESISMLPMIATIELSKALGPGVLRSLLVSAERKEERKVPSEDR